MLAVEIDPALTGGLARRFADAANVTVLRADAREVALPVNPYRIVANPPFGHTAAILHRLLDDPGGGLQRVDLVVQWQVARHRAQVSDGAAADLVGAAWAPWWRFARGRRLPAACFRPRPSVDAAVLVITRADPPELPPDDFGRYEAFLRANWGKGTATTDAHDWPSRYRGRAGHSPQQPSLHSRVESANMG